LGQTTLDFDINNSYPFAPPLRDGDDSVDEITYGIGAEFSINDHWSVTAQYSQLNDVAFDPLPEVAVPGKINDNEVDFSALTFGVNYNF
jgi:opacity protein-like surface antigen